MKKKMMIVLTLTLITLTGCGKASKNVEIPDTLVQEIDGLYIIDNDKNGEFGTTGDKKMVKEDFENEYGLISNVIITDENMSGTIEIGEITGIEYTIKNNGTSDYTIKDVNIEGNQDIFNEMSFSNLTTKNTGDAEYEFVDSKLETDDEFTLAPGEEAVFNFDAIFPNDKENSKNDKLSSDAQAYNYFTFSVVAQEGSDALIFAEIDNQKLIFSGDKIG